MTLLVGSASLWWVQKATTLVLICSCCLPFHESLASCLWALSRAVSICPSSSKLVGLYWCRCFYPVLSTTLAAWMLDWISGPLKGAIPLYNVSNKPCLTLHPECHLFAIQLFVKPIRRCLSHNVIKYPTKVTKPNKAISWKHKKY